MKRINKIVLIICGITALLFIISFIFGFRPTNIEAFFTAEYKYEKSDPFIASNNISNISVNVSDKNVVIKKHNEDNVIVNYYSKKGEKITVKEIDSTLEIKQELEIFSNWINFQFIKIEFSNIEILIPESSVLDLNINGKTGNISLKSINANDVNLNLNTGNINIIELKSNDLTIYNKTGDIYLSDINADSIDVTEQTGNIVLKNLISFDVKANNRTGNISTNNIDAKKVNLKTITGNIIIKEKTPYLITLKTKTGVIKVNNKNHGTYYTIENGNNELNASTNTGDIKFKNN